MTTCGEVLVTLLEAYEVDTVFGIPGVHTMELYRGLPATRIRHITPRHEQGAGFMADGYARASGKVGVCLIITGPGMTNIATAMAQALAPRVQVNGVAPGTVLFPEGTPEEERAKVIRRIPAGHIGSPEDVAAAVEFLAGAPDYITGTIVTVDGGASLIGS